VGEGFSRGEPQFVYEVRISVGEGPVAGGKQAGGTARCAAGRVLSRAMGFAWTLALRYARSRKRGFISLSTVFAIIGVALGSAALVAVMSVTGGFRAQFQQKVLGVNGHVMVLRSSFRDYRAVVERVRDMPEVIGVAPFLLNPMMITHAGHTVTSVMLKGIDSERVGSVLDLPQQMVEGSLAGLRSTAPSALLEAIPSEAMPSEAMPSEAALSHAATGELSDSVARLPAGSAVPPGGYGSELPPDDVLPAELEGPACSAEVAAALPGIVLGYSLREQLHAQLGDCVQVASPAIGYALSSRGVRPALARQFRVVGVFRAGFEQYDSRWAYTELQEAQALYQEGDSVTGVELKIADVDQAREVAQRVGEVLRDGPYQVLDWMELNRGLFTSLRIQQILMSLVLGLIIVVAAFTVIATLVMLVLEKKKEIAVIKAMGATDAQLLRAFVYQGLVIGLVGTGLGLGLGYGVCRWLLAHGIALDPKVYFIDHLPVRLRPEEFVFTGSFALLVCLLATIWPALYAARLRPLEAFREG
jgi:lipoprotein-releasing system permease protein